jgi:hypothetical protein
MQFGFKESSASFQLAFWAWSQAEARATSGLEATAANRERASKIQTPYNSAFGILDCVLGTAEPPPYKDTYYG